MKLFKDLFKKENKCEELEKENAELKIKLAERQEVINKRNSDWKKKLHALSKNSFKK